MKVTLVFAVIGLILASELVFGLPVKRTKRWDLFSRARNFYDNIRGHISETSDSMTDLADAVAVQAREHLGQALDHLQNIEVNSRVLLDEANRRLETIGKDILEDSRDEIAGAVNVIADAIDNLADSLETGNDKETDPKTTTAKTN